jgi:hypothetical protein
MRVTLVDNFRQLYAFRIVCRRGAIELAPVVAIVTRVAKRTSKMLGSRQE